MYKKFFLLLIITSNMSAGILWYAGHVVVGTIKTTAWAGSTALLMAGAASTYYVAENYPKLVVKNSASLAQMLIEEPGKAAQLARLLSNLGISISDIINLTKKVPEGPKFCYLTSGILGAISLYTAGKTVKSAFRTIIPK